MVTSTRLLIIAFAALLGLGISAAQAQRPGHLPPPPPGISGSGSPILPGSGGPPPPPPWLSGSGAPVLSGSGGTPPPPPDLSGSSGPTLSGSGGPPPPRTFDPTRPVGTVEALNIRMPFIATSGSTAHADGLLQELTINGTNQDCLAIRTSGLPAGAYTVSAATDTGTFSILGSFTIDPPPASPYGTPPARGGLQIGGRSGTAFPTGFNPAAIQAVTISDSNALVLFTADLSTIASAIYDASTPLLTGSGAPSGVVHIQAHLKSGVTTGCLRLAARGLAASAPYVYALDGTVAGTSTSGSDGSLGVTATEKPTGGTLPAGVNLFGVKSVTLSDGAGNLILTGTY